MTQKTEVYAHENSLPCGSGVLHTFNLFSLHPHTSVLQAGVGDVSTMNYMNYCSVKYVTIGGSRCSKARVGSVGCMHSHTHTHAWETLTLNGLCSTDTVGCSLTTEQQLGSTHSSFSHLEVHHQPLVALVTHDVTKQVSLTCQC